MNQPTPAAALDAAAATEAAEIKADIIAGLDETKGALIDALANIGIARLEAEVSLVETKPLLGAITAYTGQDDVRDLAETAPIDHGWGENHQSYDNLGQFARDYLRALLLHQPDPHLSEGTLYVRIASLAVVQPIDFAARDAEQTAARLAQFRADKEHIIALLSPLGIVKVEASYDGEGDSGQINDIYAYKADHSTVDLAKSGPVSIGTDEQNTRSFASLHELIDEFAWDVLCHHHEGFENNDGGFGDIVIDVAENAVRIEHNWRISSSEYTEAEI